MADDSQSRFGRGVHLMTQPAILRKQDMMRAAEVANNSGCRIEIKVGDTIITVIPSSENEKGKGIDYSRPVL